MATRVLDQRNRDVAKTKPAAVVVVEDNSARSHRRSEAGVTRPGANPLVIVRLHRVAASGPTVVEQRGYRTGSRQESGRRVSIALAMLDRARNARRTPMLVVAGATYGSNPAFLEGLIERGLDFAAEIRPTTRVARTDTDHIQRQKPAGARTRLRGAEWKRFEIAVPGASGPVEYHAADLGNVRLGAAGNGRLVAAQVGGIPGLHRGTMFVLTSQIRENLTHIIQAAGWARWIRAAVRRQERKALRSPQQLASPSVRDTAGINKTSSVPVRSNILLERMQAPSFRRCDMWVGPLHRQ